MRYQASSVPEKHEPPLAATIPFERNPLRLTNGDKPSTEFVKRNGLVHGDRRGGPGHGILSEKSSKTFSCPASPSARRTASWKSLSGYRTIVGGVSDPFDNMARRSLVAALTAASGWEGTQRGSHRREPYRSNKSNGEQRAA